MHDVVYVMYTTSNYSDTGRDMSVDVSFHPLPVRFRDTPRLLHPKAMHIALSRVLVGFNPYIINIYRRSISIFVSQFFCKQMKIYVYYLP